MLSYLPFIFFPFILFTLWVWYKWMTIKNFSVEVPTGNTKISVLIPVRNEAQGILNLLEDIELQSYSKENFEVLVLNDHSMDNTSQLVEQFILKTKLNCRLLRLDDNERGKKAALTKGVIAATGTLMVTTDGDCRVGQHWLKGIEQFYVKENVQMVCGPVVFMQEGNFRDQLFQSEFAVLIATGAVTLSSGFPTMCNGANLAFARKVFFEVGGYAGTENLASGDDEFLMHKIFKAYPGKVRFLKSQEIIVETKAPGNWKAFFNQRKRWSSKWEKYTFAYNKWLAVFVFLMNLGIVTNIMLSFLASYPLDRFLGMIVLKFAVDFLFLRTVLVYFGRNWGVIGFFVVEILYPFYVVLFALSGRVGKYRWKDREVN